MRYSLSIILPALLAVSCSSDTTAPDLDQPLPTLTNASLQAGPFSTALGMGGIATALDARNRALIIFPGAVITDVDLQDTERGVAVAEVKLLPAGGGGEVKLHFSLENGLLAEAEGEIPPFTYAFAPGSGFVSLAEAIASATGFGGRSGAVAQWKLQLEENGQWHYRIWVDAADGEWRIGVHARTGTVNRVQER